MFSYSPLSARKLGFRAGMADMFLFLWALSDSKLKTLNPNPSVLGSCSTAVFDAALLQRHVALFNYSLVWGFGFRGNVKNIAVHCPEPFIKPLSCNDGDTSPKPKPQIQNSTT